jgi:hypothetical protein
MDYVLLCCVREGDGLSRCALGRRRAATRWKTSRRARDGGAFLRLLDFDFLLEGLVAALDFFEDCWVLELAFNRLCELG